MARMGIFNRNDTTPEAVPRSVQDLSRRNTFDTKYMQIVPIFWQQMYPNESIKINVTNFVRSIPMNTPMFSNVRIVTRFVAVPQRIMWSSWEDYIKGDDEFSTSYEEPYIVNSGIALTDENLLSFGFRYTSPRVSEVSNPRHIPLTSSSYVPDNVSSFVAQFGVHELGDYFDAPLYTALGRSFTANQKPLRQSAFKYAAYQMAYSYFYRQPNVQTRVDDYFQMGYAANREFKPYVAYFVNGASAPLSQATTTPASMPTLGSVSYSAYKTSLGSRDAVSTQTTFTPIIYRNGAAAANILPRNIAATTDPSVSTYEQDLLRSSWDKVEHFPLKAGANLSMLAMKPNSVTGLPEYVPSNISLTRMRYANWQTDYFTSENPWQQRGEEQQIPVNGSVAVSVNLDGVTFSLTSSTVQIGSQVVHGELLDSSNNRVGGEFGLIFRQPNFVTTGSGQQVSFDSTTFNTSSSADLSAATHGILYTSGQNVPISGSASGSGTATASAVPTLYISPSQMKFALAMQHIKEAQAQIDNRYQSYIRKFFGARARDFRLDRPEFIGGCVQDLNVSEVVQQSASTDDSPIGTLAGRGVSSRTSKSIRYHAEEHTLILGLMHIIPDTEYIHGLDKEDNTQDRFDWMLPQLGHLPEQAVYNYELSVSPFGVDGNPYEVHGYEPIYNNLRWKKNSAHGAFRDWTNSLGSYAYYKPWLITRDFGYDISFGAGTLVSPPITVRSRVPTLSDEFLSGRYGVDNSNFVVTNTEEMYPFMVDSYFKVRMVRTVPTRGTVSKI